MACEVCEHCNTAVRPRERMVHGGHSYHQRCYKCYVCSETNLRNAEIFKGIIFCSNCSHRIFEDLSAFRVKKTKPKRKRYQNRVLEMARNITSSSEKSKGSSKLSTKFTVTNETYTKEDDTRTEMKKTSTEMGTTTVVTQELLKNLQSLDREEKFARAMPRKKRKHYKEKRTKNICSDVRIAELGKSTEIAHMVLRKSEVPVIIKSHSGDKLSNSSYITQETDTSLEGLVNKYYNSDYSKEFKTRWVDRRIGSMLKIPYNSFKKNILERSELINIIMSEERKDYVFKKLKKIFYEEITEHQRQGLKKLFTTINRTKIPHRLGWIQMKKIHESTRSIELLSRTSKLPRCKHYGRSHSYRCMRAHVMRRAGPTSSQLVILRKKIKDFFFFGFLKSFFDYSDADYAT